VIVQISDHAVLSMEVARADVAVDPDGITHAQLGDSRACTYRVQELQPGLDCVCDSL